MIALAHKRYDFTEKKTASVSSSHDKASDRAKRVRQTRILIDSCRSFTEKNRPLARDILAFKELFYQFIARAEVSDRRIISAILARSPSLPRSVAVFLAMDVLDVAIPFLLYSPVLSEDDLSTIGEKKGSLYREVIEKRLTPTSVAKSAHSPTATNVSLKKETIATDNRSAQSTEAPSNSKVENAASNRSKLTSGKNVFDKDIGALQSMSEDIRQTQQEEASRKPNHGGQEAIVSLAAIGGRLGRTKQNEAPKKSIQASASPASSRRHFDKLPNHDSHGLLDFARAGDTQAVAKEIAKLSGLGFEEISKLIAKSDGEEIVYLVKSLGLEPPLDMQLLLLLAPRFSRSVAEYKSARGLMSDLDIGVCRMIFNQIGAKFELTDSLSDGVTKGHGQRARPSTSSRRISDRSAAIFEQASKSRRQSVLSPEHTRHPKQTSIGHQTIPVKESGKSEDVSLAV